MTQPIPAAPCLVPPSTPPVEDTRPGLLFALALVEEQVRRTESDARRHRAAAHESDLKARALREHADHLRAQIDRLG